MAQGSSQGCRHGHDERIAVLYMPQLMGEHRYQLFTIQQAEDALCHSDSSILGITSGGKSIRSLLRNDVDARHGNPLPLRQATYERKQLRGLGLIDCLGTVHA